MINIKYKNNIYIVNKISSELLASGGYFHCFYNGKNPKQSAIQVYYWKYPIRLTKTHYKRS